MDPICLGLCSLYMQTIFKKCPFKENGKLAKLFRQVLRGLNLPAGSDIPQKKVVRGIKPRGTTFKTNISATSKKNSKII